MERTSRQQQPLSRLRKDAQISVLGDKSPSMHGSVMIHDLSSAGSLCDRYFHLNAELHKLSLACRQVLATGFQVEDVSF